MRGSGTDGRHDLPAEHGFRFFPGFYRHLPDTMKRIPGPRPGHHVFDELVAADRMMLARENGANELITAAHAPASLDDFAAVTQFMFTVCTGLGISAEDQAFFVDRLLVLLTSCDERRFGQWEKQSWWEFVDAEHRSPGFRRFLADGLTRMLVAAQAQEISARTGGYILLQLIFDLSRAGGHADRLLDGPTSEVWIDPWVAHLRGAGVDLRTEQRGRRDRLRARADRRGDGRPPRHARDGDRRPLRRGDAGRAAAPAPQPRAGQAPSRAWTGRAGCARAG